jgi:hypothetical protein
VGPNVEIFRIPAHEGTTFNYRFSLWNHGPVPITITEFGVPLAEQEGDGVTDVPVSMNPNIYAFGSETNWQPVGPITLEPRQMMAVEKHVVVTSCLEQGNTAKWNTIPISFTMYGIHRHATDERSGDLGRITDPRELLNYPICQPFLTKQVFPPRRYRTFGPTEIE